MYSILSSCFQDLFPTVKISHTLFSEILPFTNHCVLYIHVFSHLLLTINGFIFQEVNIINQFLKDLPADSNDKSSILSFNNQLLVDSMLASS